MKLIKFHGMGNDYLILADPGWDALDGAPDGASWRRRVAEICDRHTGLGGDGILLPVPAERGAQYGLRIFNPDGTTAEKSGNGLRIFARWLVDARGAPSTFTVSLPRDVVRCTVSPETIEIEMGTARIAGLSLQDLTMRGDTRMVEHAFAVDLGNPHCPIFLSSTPWDELPWKEWGRHLEHHPVFPAGTNVQFVQVLNRNRLSMRIWERGAGWTLASGSSCCAAAACAVRTPRPGTERVEIEGEESEGRCDPGWITIEMEGGELSVHVPEEGSVTLRGPVEEVGSFRFSRSWLDSRTKEPPRGD